MKTILLPTDFSPKSHNAVEYALELFSGEDVRFLLLNVYDLASNPTEIRVSALQGRIGLQPRRELIVYLEQLKTSFKKYLQGNVVFETYAEFGKVAQVIINFTKSYPIDYIIMGTEKNNHYFEQFFSRSNVRKVLQKVNCPVIAVPEKLKYKKPEKIVFVTHLKSPIRKDKLAPLHTISQKFNSAITVLNIINSLTSNLLEQEGPRFKNMLGESLSSFCVLQETKIDAALNFFLHQDETDMFVVQHKNDLADNLFQSKIRQKTNLLKNIPILRLNL